MKISKILIHIKSSPYLQNFVVALASIIGYYIVFLAFGLDISRSIVDFLSWIGIVILFVLFIVLLKYLFKWIIINDLIDGVWFGIIIFVWSYIFTLSWKNNIIDSILGSIFPILMGIFLFWIGYKYRNRNKI